MTMANEKEADGRDSINLNENYEVQAWCQMFEVSSFELKEAINKVGRSALKVREYFKLKRVKMENAYRSRSYFWKQYQDN
jgi:hypothetical protein